MLAMAHTAHLALSRRRVIKHAAAVAAGLAAPSFLHIRSVYAGYPDRPVKIVVANTPGGPSDLVGRMITAALQQSTGKAFIIENIGGAGGNIGMGTRIRKATAIQSCSRPTRIRSMPAFTAKFLMPRSRISWVSAS
jgi:tripartite-type tricarboxylate transporter receptor subunit TctC